jgi:hypothetical protein
LRAVAKESDPSRGAILADTLRRRETNMKKSMAFLTAVLATMGLGTNRAGAQERSASASVTDAAAQDSTDNAKSSSEIPDENPRTLLSGNLAHGGFGAPHVKVTPVSGQAGLLVGGRGAWVIGHSLTLGGGGYGLATHVDAPEAARGSLADASISLGYGGVRIGYIFFPQEMVHFSTGLLIGGGGVSVLARRNQSDNEAIHTGSVFVLEPEAALEINITRSIRGAIDVSYRYMSDPGIAGLSSTKIGGPAAGATVAFGWF